MALSTGSRLGVYEILGLLGIGGMGEVYKARDTRLRREVAVKVLPQELASTSDRLARFEREARTVAGLSHPNIVTLFSFEEAAGLRFLTMELVQGRRLDALISPGGLPLSRILELSIPIADALVAAHQSGVVHRDLKPSNVMVTHQGWVKVLDFGLAKIMRDKVPAGDETRVSSDRDPLSEAGGVFGTMSYMAPEQIRGQAVDARCDLFALGVILYELATGRRPFTGETPADVTSSILRDAPPSLRRARADLPGDLERVVVRCLEKSPRDRLQTALDVLRELRGTRLTLEPSGPEEPASAGVASIAVLPFANRSGDKEDEYFSDGLADELLDTLAKIRGLRVAARASSFQFKAATGDLATIGRRLNVATVLDGSVRKSGHRVRISVQLVKVSDGYPLWSQTYDRALDDVFAVQDEIAQSVVEELRRTLLLEGGRDVSGQANAEVAMATKGRTVNAEARRLHLLARHLLDRWTREDASRAIECLEEALRRDPDFAVGWAELCRAHRSQADQGWVPVAEGYRLARDAARRALSLEPDLAEAHARMAWIQMSYDWDWRSAAASYARAMELAPGSISVLLGAGLLARYQGRLDDAIALCRRALELDPLSGGSYHNLGWILHDADRFSEAVDAYRKALELAPQRVITRAHLALSLLAQGRAEEALQEAKREPESAYRLWSLAIVHDTMGQRVEACATLEQLISSFAESDAYQIAEVFGARGDVDEAFRWLDRGYAQRDGGLCHMLASPRLRSLRGDPRWGRFLEKMGLGL